MTRFRITFADHPHPLHIWGRNASAALRTLCDTYATARGKVMTSFEADPAPALAGKYTRFAQSCLNPPADAATLSPASSQSLALPGHSGGIPQD